MTRLKYLFKQMIKNLAHSEDMALTRKMIVTQSRVKFFPILGGVYKKDVRADQ